MATTAKSERIDVRTTPVVKQVLQEAARMVHKSVSEFLVDSASTAANEVLADRRLFHLDENAWQEFHQALDRPVRPMPRLKKLLQEPGVFD